MTRILISDEGWKAIYLINNEGTCLLKETRDKNSNDYKVVGMLGHLNKKRYWLYCDPDNVLWFMGDSLEPIRIDKEDTTSNLVASADDLILTIRKRNKTVLEIKYPQPPPDELAYFDFTAASMDDERGNFGKTINRIINQPDPAGTWKTTK